MNEGPAPRESSVEAELAEWRRKAVNLFSAASAVAYLPAVALMVAGAAPPNGWPAQVLLVCAYLSCVSCAVLPNADHRVRAWTLVAAIYVVALIHLITIPAGPLGRALSTMLPILAIVVLGARPAWAVTGTSMGLILIGPLLQHVPALVEMLTLEPAGAPTPANVVFHQGIALIALLAGQMVLLDRFHEFLMRSLAKVKLDAADLSAAHSKLQREMLERRRLENEVARATDEERRRLGSDIHDGLCQQLTGALLRTEAMTRRKERGDALRVDELSALSSLIEEAIDEAHAIAQGLASLESDPQSLTTALRALAKRTQRDTGISCAFTAVGDVSILETGAAQHLYRIAQEALNNAVRHAHAHRIAVELRGTGDGLVLEIEDDGDGLPSNAKKTGMGLRTMAYRAQLLAGEFAVTSTPSGGTRVSCWVPRAALTVKSELAEDIGKEKDET